jgi:hypothetical protein
VPLHARVWFSFGLYRPTIPQPSWLQALRMSGRTRTIDRPLLEQHRSLVDKNLLRQDHMNSLGSVDDLRHMQVRSHAD